jgi:hypothetical protein
MSGHGVTHTSYERQEGLAVNVKQEKLNKIDERNQRRCQCGGYSHIRKDCKGGNRDRVDRGQLISQ